MHATGVKVRALPAVVLVLLFWTVSGGSIAYAEDAEIGQFFQDDEVIFCITEQAARQFQRYIFLETTSKKEEFISQCGCKTQVANQCYVYKLTKPIVLKFVGKPLRGSAHEGTRIVRGKYLDQNGDLTPVVFFITDRSIEE